MKSVDSPKSQLEAVLQEFVPDIEDIAARIRRYPRAADEPPEDVDDVEGMNVRIVPINSQISLSLETINDDISRSIVIICYDHARENFASVGIKRFTNNGRTFTLIHHRPFGANQGRLFASHDLFEETGFFQEVDLPQIQEFLVRCRKALHTAAVTASTPLPLQTTESDPNPFAPPREGLEDSYGFTKYLHDLRNWFLNNL